MFWDDIAEKLNEVENTNYFTGEEYRKKFSKPYKILLCKYPDSKNLSGEADCLFYLLIDLLEHKKKGVIKKSLIGDEIYDEFSSKFWTKPVQVRNGNVGRSRDSSQQESVVDEQPSSSGSTEVRRPERSSKEMSVETRGPERTRSSTPSTIEPPTISARGASSRPVTPTLPSFSQSANTINITINNYAGPDEQED